MKFVTLSAGRTGCLWLCVLCLGCNDPVAVDDTAAAKPVPPVVLDEQTVVQDADDKATQHDDKQGTLIKARDLLRQADKSSGGVTKWLGDRLQDATDGGQDAASGSLEWANRTFESLKKQGLTTAGSAQEWVLEDYTSMGAWEYKVVKMLPADLVDETEAELNKLGAKRWECFNVVAPTPPQTHYLYYFKREKKSYLKSLPLKDLMRLVPLMGGDGESN